jgi:hypothetical protein
MQSQRWLLKPDQTRLAYQITHKDSKLRIFAARNSVYVTLHFDDGQAGGVSSIEKTWAAIAGYDDLGRRIQHDKTSSWQALSPS